MKLLDTDFTGIINLGTGVMNSVNKITTKIEQLSGKKIISENKKVEGPMNLEIDITLLKELTGWKPSYSLDEGLTKTYEIMKGYYKK